LKECDVYIPVISRAALASPWCEEEISIAIMLGKEPGRNGKPRIIPVIVENCVSEMYSFLKVRLYVDFSNRYNAALKELLGFMQEIADKPQ
jgi:hypothetical protein